MVCSRQIPREAAMTDKNGKPVQEECYALKMRTCRDEG
jgi:hypothetical protein